MQSGTALWDGVALCETLEFAESLMPAALAGGTESLPRAGGAAARVGAATDRSAQLVISTVQAMLGTDTGAAADRIGAAGRVIQLLVFSSGRAVQVGPSSNPCSKCLVSVHEARISETTFTTHFLSQIAPLHVGAYNAANTPAAAGDASEFPACDFLVSHSPLAALCRAASSDHPKRLRCALLDVQPGSADIPPEALSTLYRGAADADTRDDEARGFNPPTEPALLCAH